MTLKTLALAALLTAAPAAAAPPHVVVILADDLGYSDLGSYGGEIETPHLDRLAARGVRFTQFYATPRCSPTRAALLTGLQPHQAGVGHLNHDWRRPAYRGRLASEAATLAELLGAAGYRTYMVGKWHLALNPPGRGRPVAEEVRRSWPRGRGFDRYFGVLRGSGSYYQPTSLVRDDTPIEPGEGFYLTDALSSEAAGFVREHFAEHPSRPMLLYLAYTAPHWPLQAPAEAVERVAGRYDAGWDALRRERYRRMVEMGLLRPEWRPAPRDPEAPPWEEVPHPAWQARRMEVYAAMVERMDSGIGEVLAAFEAAGALDDTLVVFLSDNGACAEELTGVYRLGAYVLGVSRRTPRGRLRFGDLPGLMPGPVDTFQTYGPGWSGLSNTPFRGHKRSTWEGGIATPLIVHWPTGLGAEPGSLVHAPGHVTDLLPTILEAAGAARPASAAATAPALAGESLLPLLHGGDRPDRPLVWEHEGNRAVREGRWKLVSRWPGGWQLYDLEADRTELNDLAAQEPRRVEALAARFDRFAAAAGVAAWPWVVLEVRRLTWGAAALLVLAVGWAWRRRRLRTVPGMDPAG